MELRRNGRGEEVEEEGEEGGGGDSILDTAQLEKKRAIYIYFRIYT